jgi:penicillin-binding protein 1A
VRSPLDVNGAYVPSMGLGAIRVSPLDLASAYATLAAGGIHSEPMAIRRVVLSNGKVDTDAGWGEPRRKRVISDGVAYAVTDVLEDNMTGGTGGNAYFGVPAAGKTGTTENHADAWFAGYTPTLQTTVWVGYTRGNIPMESVHGISVSGSSFPSLIWHDFMVEAVGNQPPLDFPQPSNWAVWRDWERGTEGRSHGYYYDPDDYVPQDDGEEQDEPEEEEPEETQPPSTPASPAARKPKPPKPTPPSAPSAPAQSPQQPVEP